MQHAELGTDRRRARWIGIQGWRKWGVLAVSGVLSVGGSASGGEGARGDAKAGYLVEAVGEFAGGVRGRSQRFPGGASS